MRYSILTIVVVIVGCYLASAPLCAQNGGTGGPAGFGGRGRTDTEKTSVVKFYDIADLITPGADMSYQSERWPGTGLLSNSQSRGQSQSMISGGQGGGMGGGMGGYGMGGYPGSGGPGMSGPGGDGMGGSGMGGSGMGGGGMGGMGMGGGYGGMGSAVSVNRSTRTGGVRGIDSDRRDLIFELVKKKIGENEQVNAIYGLDNLLIVQQSEPVHAKVAAMLDALRTRTFVNTPLVVEWFVATEDPTATDGGELTEERISGIAEIQGSAHCLNRQLMVATRGTHVNYVTRVMPVVGGSNEGVGYSPTTVQPLIGWMIELQASLSRPSPDNIEAMIDVVASQTKLASGEETVDMPESGTIDRIAIAAQTLAGSTRVGPGKWTLVASYQGRSGGEKSAVAGATALPDQPRWLMVRWRLAESGE